MNISKQLSKWIDELKVDFSYNNLPIPAIRLLETDKNDKEDADLRYEIITKYHLYRIAAYRENKTYQGEESYLGCILYNRYPWKGENWPRGSDLPDGEFDNNTWELIKEAIINNEFKPMKIKK